ncbi:MAG: NUDIX domain-containing protein [Deltaproteobacteria bacterium]|jgi:S-adenosylhomocysteine hydrolase/8-oxo-dGTP pyrophosphatase MutT (NUDIX family)|nr:NUDIX domain-containing protein [Deltaproteobacteria bacterium]
MQVKTLFENYIKLYTNEIAKLRLLSEQLSQSEDITSRKNFIGHVTASAFVINDHTKQVLLLEHRSLAKLLQPGGHIEKDDESPLAATLREIEEETGLKIADLTLRPISPRERELPFDIDTHYIPENPKKGEPGHYHHDFRYVYTTESSNVAVDPTEANGYRWIDWEQFAELSNFAKVADKIDTILEPSPRDFFRSLTNEKSHEISIVAVSHIIPSSEAYIQSLQENFNLIGIIPKPKSIDKHTFKKLKTNGVAILDQFSREGLVKNPDELADLLESYNKVCLIDIGAYFYQCMDMLKDRLGDKLLGVIEDTENGHQKYEKHLSGKYTVVSVARSPLKDFEDQLVGHSVAHATETILRQINTLITYKDCGIIGYGKIGRGISDYLKQRGVRPRVSEINAVRAIQASCDGMAICSTEDLLKKSDVIFCATGARALDLLKFRDLKKGAFLTSVTSSDDEFNLQFVDSEYKKNKIAENITRYSKRGHNFHLLNDGNAVNFLYSAAVDKYINLVQGELIFSASNLADVKHKPSKTIIVNSSEDCENIARLWLDVVMRAS